MIGRKSETPTKGVSDYLKQLKKHKYVIVPSPDGKGSYRIELRSGSVYFACKCIWIANDQKDKEIGRRVAPAYLRNTHGREILWYPRGLGVSYLRQGAEKYGGAEEYLLATAKMLLGFILSGRRPYKMNCGQNINSLNTDADLGANGRYDYY